MGKLVQRLAVRREANISEDPCSSSAKGYEITGCPLSFGKLLILPCLQILGRLGHQRALRYATQKFYIGKDPVGEIHERGLDMCLELKRFKQATMPVPTIE